MRALASGALVLGALLMANVVAAGVMAVLGPLAARAEDPTAQVAGVAVVGVMAIAAALLFLKGCLRVLIDATTMPGRPARGKGSAHGPER